jgi:Acyl-ACP thioesterase
VRQAWSLRFADFDVMGHVNNAAYWQVVEEAMARRPRHARDEGTAASPIAAGPEPPAPDGAARAGAGSGAGPLEAWGEVEYRDGVGVGDDLLLASAELSEGSTAIWFEVDGFTRASARLGAGRRDGRHSAE